MQVAVRGRRPAVGVFEKGDPDGMGPRAPVSGDFQVLTSSAGGKRVGHHGPADLLAIDADGELRVAVPCVLRQREIELIARR